MHRVAGGLYGDENGELSMAMAVYMLGFNTYMGFGDKIRGELGEWNVNSAEVTNDKKEIARSFYGSALYY